MSYPYFRNLALIFGLALTLGTTLLIYLGYADPVEAMGQALFVLILVCAVLFFQKGGGWAAAAASVIYIAALMIIGPKGDSAFVLPAIILRVTLYGFTGVAGGEICARVKTTLENLERSDLVDHESGLFNKDYFFRLVGANVEMFERYQAPFSVLVFSFNQDDTKGLSHEQLKEALQLVGREVKETIRPSDEAGRPDATTLALILDQTTGEKAEAVISRVTAAFKRALGEKAKIDVQTWSTPDDLETIRTYAHAR